MASAGDNPFLTQLGLTNHLFREDGGKLAANMLESSLSYVTNLTVSIDVRTDIARMISKWQEQATPANRHDGFKNCFSKLVETIEFILIQPQSTIAGFDQDPQLPAFYLTQALAREATVTQLSTFGPSAGSALVELFRSAISQISDFRENPHNPHSRTHTVRNIVTCLPNQGTNEQMDSLLTVLFQTLPKLTSAPLLQQATVLKIQSILSANTTFQSPTNRHLPTPTSANTNTNTQFLFDTHLINILHAVRCGHTQLSHIITSNKSLCSAHNPTIEQHLSAMIESLGVGALEVLLQDLADLEPRKLLPSLSALVHQLGNSGVLVQHKVLVLSVLLSVVQVQGAAPLVPLLGSVGSVCSDQPELYIPLFKLLTTVSVGSVGSGSGSSGIGGSGGSRSSSGGSGSNSGSSDSDVTTQTLVLVSTIAKSAVPKTPAVQSAILDCVNILKDQCKYSNIFHTDTLKVFEVYSVYNIGAYKNIVVWNSGKSAKKGNNGDFLINAGVVSTGASGGGWWFSPKKSSSVSVSSIVSGSNSVGNSTNSSPLRGGSGSYAGGSVDIRGAEGVSSPLNTYPTQYTQAHNINPYPANTYLPNTTYPTTTPYTTPYTAPYTTPYSPYPPTHNTPVHTTPAHTKAHSVAPSPQSQNLALLQQQLYAQQQHIQHQMLLMQQLQIQEQLAMYEHSSGSGSGSGMGGGVGGGIGGVGGVMGCGMGSVMGNVMNSGVNQYSNPPNGANAQYAANIGYHNNYSGSNVNSYVLGVQGVAGVPIMMGINPPQSPVHNYNSMGVNNAYNTQYMQNMQNDSVMRANSVAPAQLFPTNTTSNS